MLASAPHGWCVEQGAEAAERSPSGQAASTSMYACCTGGDAANSTRSASLSGTEPTYETLRPARFPVHPRLRSSSRFRPGRRRHAPEPPPRLLARPLTVVAAFSLKPYQQQALDALESYLHAARLQGARSAFESETGYGYNTQPFGEVPCVCLRIPTGGGKTLLAAHAVGVMAREWPNVGPMVSPVSPKPLALWLVPSDTIRAQTLAALGKVGHPFREALAEACGDNVRVCDLDEVATSLTARTSTLGAVVVVATIQSFRHRRPRTSAASTLFRKPSSRTSAACPPGEASARPGTIC